MARSSVVTGQVLFLKSYSFLKHRRIIKHAFLGKVVILGAYCDICLYMLKIVYACNYMLKYMLVYA